MARKQHGAEIVNFDQEDRIAVLKDLINGSGPDRAIHGVGVDAATASKGLAAKKD